MSSRVQSFRPAATGAVTHGDGPVRGPDPEPPPPGGLLWNDIGDIRTLITLAPAFILQVAHPAVGAGVDDHSAFRTDPWGRGVRSMRSVLLWVYGGEQAVEEGRRLRALHRSITGADAHGRPYHALHARTYAWVHATGFPISRYAHPYLWGRPFTPAEERRLYAEWRQVGQILGIPERELPLTVEEFWPYYHRVLAELEMTRVARELLDPDAPLPVFDLGPRLLRVPVRALWPVLRPLFLRLRRFLSIGLLPPEARAVLGLPWTPRQERGLSLLCKVVSTVVPRLPSRLRYFPSAHAARVRHGLGRPRGNG
ncbi:oxygenase MpaB family protein [Streptomyces uncialis]|uniref:oxygenase MpaB family protein n=1 Tax=Streptomyces uncialis TaxID=1048205 RepID=UPI0009A0DEAD|nr:oxygenase MpaB family protein [Streptomyces uncialis]